MKYLSGIDNLFLNQETSTQYMHVGGLGIYDPSTAAGGKVRFKTVLDFFTSQMGSTPLFRRRLTQSPLGLDRPFWIEDGGVDVEYHVRHLALPDPGDWRQLMIQIARLHSRPLDMSKPLWEAYIIEGLDSIPGLPKNSFALYLKFHHALLDGEAAAHLIGSMHTAMAEFDPDSMNEAHTVVMDREPTSLELITRAVANRSKQMIGVGELSLALGKHALNKAKEQAPSLLKTGEEFLHDQFFKANSQQHKRPKTRFNEDITSHRVLDAVGFSMDDFSAIRKNVDGITINDIFLTIAGGALQRYLVGKDEETKTSLMGTMPMTLRGSKKGGDEGNQIAQVYYSLKTDIDDPVARLRAIHDETAGLKDKNDDAIGKDIQKRLLDVLPASLIARSLTHALGANANVNVSNVRGPSSQLYMAGARLEMFIPFSVIFDGCGLNLTGFSYNGTLWVALTCCRKMLPDPENFIECLTQSLEELVTATRKPGKVAGGRTRKAASRKKATRVRQAAKPGKISVKEKAPAKKKAATRKRISTRKP